MKQLVTLATLAGMLTIVAASAEAAPPAKSGAPPAISMEWRRDVWQAPELRTTDVDGNNASVVARDIVRGGRPRWSPDGLRLGGYLRSTTGAQWDRSIMSIWADGTDERLVLTSARFDQFNVSRGLKSAAAKGFGLPFDGEAWSPDGTALVFSGLARYEGPSLDDRDDRYQYRIFSVGLDGTMVAVTDGDAEVDDFDPHWSWALDKIVFVRSQTSLCAACEGRPDRVGQPELWAVNPDGFGLQQITTFGQTGPPSSGEGTALAAPVWSHAADLLAVVGNLGVGLYTGDLWILELDHLSGMAIGSRVLRGEAGVAEWHPSWSPDDGRLVFRRQRAANKRTWNTQIVIVDLATGAENVIVDQTKQVPMYPDWNPITAAP